MYNASDRKDVRKAEKAAAQAERERTDFLCAAMNTIQGRAWIYDLLAACHLFTDHFTGDALVEAYLKGERNVGLRIFADISANCPDQYILMMREANIKEIANAARNRSPATEQPGGEDIGWDVEGSELDAGDAE